MLHLFYFIMKPMTHLFCPLTLLIASNFLLVNRGLTQLQPFEPMRAGTSISNVRIANQSKDGTEATLIMDVSYDGSRGSTAVIMPIFENKKDKSVSVSKWFGADMVTVGQGKGTISLKVKYFNDEPEVPSQLSTDTIRVLVLNDSRRSVISGTTVLKTIKWGSADGPAVKITPAPRVEIDEKTANEQARLAAEAETKAREAIERAAAAEAKARMESLAREEARKKAESDARRIEEGKQKADEQSRKLAQERARQETEAKALDAARQKAAAEAREEARLRAVAEAKAKEEAEMREKDRLRAEAEVRRLVEEKRLAEERAKKEAEQQEKARLAEEVKKREAERARAEAEAKRLAVLKLKEEAKAREEAQLREQARLKAEVEAKQRAEAEVKARQESLARDEAKMKAEAEAKRLDEEKRVVDQKAARLQAEERAKKEAEAKSKAEDEARQLAAQRLQAEERAKRGPAGDHFAIAPGMKSKVTNVDVVNRSVDRTQMTIGVEFEYKDDLGAKPLLGVSIARTGDPQVTDYFSSNPMEIGKSRRNFALFPVKFQPPASQSANWNTFATDKVLVYLAETASAKKLNLFPATMMLLWRPPGGGAGPASPEKNSSTITMEDFKQNDLFSGQVTVRYHLIGDAGRIRVRVLNASNPASASWFEEAETPIKGGRGIQILKIGVNPDAKIPTDVFKADTIAIDLLDSKGNPVATEKKESPMSWAKPK